MIEYLREFVCLADTLNYTEAARILYIAQPVLSKHILKLEEELGVRLFERTKRHVELTDAGKVVLGHARAVVASYDALEVAVEDFKRGMMESIVVGYLFGAVSDVVPTAHSRFLKLHPDVDLSYRIYSYFDIGSALENDQADVVIASSFEEPRELLAHYGFESIELFREETFAVVDKMHPLASCESLCAADFKGAGVLVPRDQSSFQLPAAFREYFDGVDVRWVKRLDQLDNIPILLEVEQCITTLPEHLLGYFEKHNPGRLVFLPIRDLDTHLSVSVMWKSSNRGKHLAEYAAVFKGAISESRSL